MNIRLKSNYTIIRRDSAPEKIGSIIVPDSVRAEQTSKAYRGTVVGVGPGVHLLNGKTVTPDFKNGAAVLFSPDKIAYVSLAEYGENLVAMRAWDVLALYVEPNIVPLQDRVVIRRAPEAQASRGGIIFPDSVKEKPLEGELVAVGAGRVTGEGEVQKLDVRVGERVLFDKYSGTEIEIGGETLIIARESDLLAVVEAS